METDSCHKIDGCLNRRCRLERHKRYFREGCFNDWSHIMWTRRQAPEWQPRRASVATCQQQQQSTQNKHGFELMHHFGLTNSSSIKEISRDCKYQQQQEQQHQQQRTSKQDRRQQSNQNDTKSSDTSTVAISDKDHKTNTPQKSCIRVSGHVDDEEKNMIREDLSDESSGDEIYGGSREGGNQLLENLDQGKREKRSDDGDDDCRIEMRNEAIVELTKEAAVPQNTANQSHQPSTIKTTSGVDMDKTSSSTMTSRVGERKDELISGNEDVDSISNCVVGRETEAKQQQQQALPIELKQDDNGGDEDNSTSETSSRTVSSEQSSRPTLDLYISCENCTRHQRRRRQRRATAPPASLVEESTCCPKSTATTTTLDGLAGTASTTTTTTTRAARVTRNSNADDEEVPKSVAVREKLQLQDKQRKCLIFSMALKQLIAGRRLDLSTTKSIMATPGQDCCYCNCRSRSCSFNLVNSSPSGRFVCVGSVGRSGSSGSGGVGGSDGDSATVKADQVQHLTTTSDFRTVLSSSRSALIDKLQTGRTTASTANSIMETQLKINSDESEKNSKLQRKTEPSYSDILTLTTTISDQQSSSKNKALLSSHHQRSSIELLSYSSAAIEEVIDQKMNTMRQLIVNKCNSGQQQQQGLEWCDRSNDDSPSADSCELENEDIDEEILESRTTLTTEDRLNALDSDEIWNNNNNNNDSFINRLPHSSSTVTDRRSQSVQSKSSNISEDLIALETDDLNLEAFIVESWLDDHPKFAYEYFMRKASHQMIDDWLIAHAKVSSNTNLNHRFNNPTTSNVCRISRPSSQQSLNPSARGSLRRADGIETTSTTPNNWTEPRSADIDGSPSFALECRSNRSNSQSSASYYQEAMTPVRKISATDFESRSGSGLLRPLLSTTPDGRLTFLSQPSPLPNVYDSIDQSTLMRQQQQRNEGNQSRRNSYASEIKEATTIAAATTTSSPTTTTAALKSSEEIVVAAAAASASAASGGDVMIETHEFNKLYGNQAADDDELPPGDGEVKLIFELVKNICNDLDIRTLLHKILRNISVLINADKSSLFLVYGEPNDPNRHLVSQLFNVDQDSAEFNETEDCIKIPWGTGLVGYVAESGESVNIANCYDDPRFTNSIDKRTGYLTKHMLCAPIFDNRNDIVGVAQVINKRDGNPFSRSDEIKFKRYLQFCGIGLRNAQSYENCQLENKRNQVLLDLARMVFEEQSTIEQVVYRIMLHTQSLLECQRCQVLLIDDGSEDLDQLLKLPSTVSGVSDRDAAAHNNNNNNNNNCSNNNMTSPVVIDPPEWRPQCHHHTSTNRANKVRVKNSHQIDGDYPAAPADLSNEDGVENNRMIDSASKKLFSLVFDLECDGNDPVMHSTKGGDIISNHASTTTTTTTTTTAAVSNLPVVKNHKFPINIGITGYVAMTGETLNIEDAHSHERFDPSVDDNSDFKHKSILCMPIRNGKRQIIGVSQLINKKNGRAFNKNDENLFEAFAIFCGLGIHNTLMYERVLKIMAKQKVTFEVLSYHATAPLEEAKRLSLEQIPSCFALDLGSLKFNDFSLDEQYMLKSCLRFFLDLDLMRRFQIDQLVFCNWILSVQKNYRKVTYHPIVGGNGLKASPVRYHNWRHAFNVSQMMFAILVNTQICQALGELETLALLIACLCHDLDHRGTNNSFQIKSASPLAELYSTSTMEHHHFDQCVMILNSQGNQILANLSPAEYSKVIMLLEEAILATDLANYFKKRDTFFQLINGNKFNWKRDPNHRSLLRCMLMTACDVAAITKPWPIQKVVADLVMSEFYQQGDIERNELNIEPIDMMNRDKMSKLPEMQIGFIDSICAPIYTAFAKLFPRELGPLIDGCLANRILWTEMANNNVQVIDSRNIGFLTNNIEFCAEQTGLLPKNISKSETHLCRRSSEGIAKHDHMSKKEKDATPNEFRLATNKLLFKAVSNQDRVELRCAKEILDPECQRKSI